MTAPNTCLGSWFFKTNASLSSPVKRACKRLNLFASMTKTATKYHLRKRNICLVTPWLKQVFLSNLHRYLLWSKKYSHSLLNNTCTSNRRRYHSPSGISWRLEIVAEMKCLSVYRKHDTEALRSPPTAGPESFWSTHEWLNLVSKLGMVFFSQEQWISFFFLSLISLN